MAHDRGGPAEEPGDALEAAVRGMQVPPARAAFRADLRAAFVQSVSRAPADDRMRAIVAERLEERIRRTPLAPPARPAFRDALRERFVLADASEGQDTVGAGARKPVSRLRMAVVLTLAAAAAVLVTIFVPSDPVWSVREVPGSGPIEVAGTSFTGDSVSSSDKARMGSELSLGGRIVSGARELSLDLLGFLRVRVRAGTTVEFDPLPALDTAEPIVVLIHRGEVFFETLPGYPGNPILIRSAQATVSVTGTALGVLVDDGGTCTCVARGSVWVKDRSGRFPDEHVTAGNSYRLFDGAMPPKRLVFAPEGDEAHRAHTQALVDFVARVASDS